MNYLLPDKNFKIQMNFYSVWSVRYGFFCLLLLIWMLFAEMYRAIGLLKQKLCNL